MKFYKFKKSTRFLAITIALLTLALSLPITAFAADDVEPQYSIIHTPDGGTMSVDPNVVKVDEISGYLFEDPLGSSRSAVERMERSSVTVENMGSFAVSEYDDFWMQTPPQAASTVTWSVSNSYLASVDSSGTVYVTTAGAFYLNALFFDSNGKAWCYRYHFVIEVSNGVYKFKNKANNMYIELPAGNIAEGTEYILWQEESNRNSEFKITDVGVGVYTIRSMVANHVGMSKSSDDRLVNSFVDTGPDTDLNNEAYIVDEDLWGIASSSQGYYIYNITGGVAGNYTITPQIDEEPPTFALSYFNQSTSQYWSFISVAPIKHGVDIRNSTDTLAVGDTFQFTATMYSSYFNVHGQHGITWSITSGSSYASINPSTGVLTAVSPGSVTVTATYTYRTNISWSKNYEVKCILPLSGYELDYDASLWSYSSPTYLNNCYAYAINNQVLPGTNSVWFLQQPGSYAGSVYASLTESSIANAVSADFDEHNDNFNTSLTFLEIDRFDTCPAGTYKVALVVGVASDGTPDYHWYRQDSDGLWSHKQGTTDVKRTDESGNLIYDPYTADRGGYTQFLGYYIVEPWNNMLNTSNNVKYYCSCTNLEYPTYQMFYAHYLQNHQN